MQSSKPLSPRGTRGGMQRCDHSWPGIDLWSRRWSPMRCYTKPTPENKRMIRRHERRVEEPQHIATEMLLD